MTLCLAAAGLSALLLAPPVASPSPVAAATIPAAPETGPVAVPEPTEKAMRYYRSGNVVWAIDTLIGLLVPALFLFAGASAWIRNAARRVDRNWFFTIVASLLILVTLYLAHRTAGWFIARYRAPFGFDVLSDVAALPLLRRRAHRARGAVPGLRARGDRGPRAQRLPERDPGERPRGRADRAADRPRAGGRPRGAYPHPTTIGLYQAGQGHPKFDEAKAYIRKVCDKVRGLVADTIRRWDEAGV